MNKFYLTTPIYYASGVPHIGHSFTTIYADVISRYQKLKGNDVFFAAGMDEHGLKIAEKAEEAEKTPQQFVDGISEQYVRTWSLLGIEYTDFIRTTSERHKQGVLEFIKKIKQAGDIYEGFYEGLYCVGCEDFVTEKNLTDGLCPVHLKPPQRIKEKNYFFKLEKYLPVIREKIIGNELEIIPESRKNEILSIIDSGISDFSISRDSQRVKWGIPFPDDETQIIYVWVEALMNYVTILDFPGGEKFRKFWPADIHLIGAEISKFHAIFWPGLLMSANLPLPQKIFIHGLFTINSQKISKTLGNVIDPIDLIKEFGADATRYLLLSQFPASEHGDIKAAGFKSKYNDDLANGLGNLFERIFTMIINYNIKISKDKVNETMKKWVDETRIQYQNHLEHYDLFNALRDIFSLTKKLDQYINEKEPWKLSKQGSSDLSLILNSLFFGIEAIIQLMRPFMPSKTEIAQNYVQKLKQGNIPKEKLNLFPRMT